MNVLIIPEDFRKDQYVLKPIVSAMMRALGRAQAREAAANYARVRQLCDEVADLESRIAAYIST